MICAKIQNVTAKLKQKSETALKPRMPLPVLHSTILAFHETSAFRFGVRWFLVFPPFQNRNAAYRHQAPCHAAFAFCRSTSQWKVIWKWHMASGNSKKAIIRDLSLQHAIGHGHMTHLHYEKVSTVLATGTPGTASPGRFPLATSNVSPGRRKWGDLLYNACRVRCTTCLPQPQQKGPPHLSCIGFHNVVRQTWHQAQSTNQRHCENNFASSVHRRSELPHRRQLLLLGWGCLKCLSQCLL